MSLAKQMRHRDKEMVPRILVQAMFALMLASLGIVAYAQWFDVPNRGVLVEAPIVQSRCSVVSGDGDGAYEVFADGVRIRSSAEGLNGFIGVLGRAIDRQREVRGLPLDAPLQVVRRENDHVAVIDPATGKVFELIGYGKDNVAAFAQLLD